MSKISIKSGNQRYELQGKLWTQVPLQTAGN